jgi:LCP family protein required for cell wall assembly
MSILDTNYINIMLIGVDHSEERDSDEWTGKTDFHADVMIVLTINKATNEVSMISLPRDTYAKIPGVSGIYKLNASLNCGGGWPTEGGFKKVCQAAQWMLGGSGSEEDPVRIDYYFAVDMNAVKELVDKIGGITYDLEISFSIQGRSYTKGDGVYMDGQAVLDYMRVRKEATGSHEGIAPEDADGATTDKNRVNRQKKMLVAIFQKLKDEGLLYSIPSLLESFDGNLYYNMTTAQVAALAYYALVYVDPDAIQMYSMSGSYVSMFGEYCFTFTNQSNRVKIIKDVYGIEVPQRSKYTLSARSCAGKCRAAIYIKVSEPVLAVKACWTRYAPPANRPDAGACALTPSLRPRPSRAQRRLIRPTPLRPRFPRPYHRLSMQPVTGSTETRNGRSTKRRLANTMPFWAMTVTSRVKICLQTKRSLRRIYSLSAICLVSQSLKNGFTIF